MSSLAIFSAFFRFPLPKLDLPATKFEPNQELKVLVDPPVVQGNITFVLIDALNTEELKEEVEVDEAEMTFSYTFSENPHEGDWKVYIYWYNETTGGVQTETVNVTVPFTIDPGTLITVIVIIVIASVIGISSYSTIKKMKRKKNERRENIYNKYMDALNLTHVRTLQ